MADIHSTALLQEKVIGALAGLVRACGNNPKSKNTDRVVLTALTASASRVEGELSRQLKAIAEEKNAVSPGCAVCPNPCGNTSDYDMDQIRHADPEVRSAKLALLAMARMIAPHALAALENGTPSEEVISYLFRAVTVLSWDWDPEQILPVLREGGRIYCLCTSL